MDRYLHYIWDFDGTLFDSYPHSTAALCAAAAHFGIPVEPEQVSRWLRTSFATAFRALDFTEAQQAYFRSLHGDPAFPPSIVPFPQARPVLEALAARGARHYLYTHSRRRMSVAYLERFGLAPLFSGFMTPDDPGFASKPDPGGLLRLMADRAVPPDLAVMVGDREIDMRCARAAGIDGILVDPDHLVAETCAVRRCATLAEVPGERDDAR